jgi:hypothetical protein
MEISTELTRQIIEVRVGAGIRTECWERRTLPCGEI